MASARPAAAIDEVLAGMYEDLEFATEVGDMSEEEVLSEALSEYDADPREIAAAVGRAFMEKRAREASFPKITACDRLDVAFAALRNLGFIAMQAAGGSLEEGMSLVEAAWSQAEEQEELWAFVFFHLEDVEKALDFGRMHLAFGVIPPAAEAKGEHVTAEVAGDIVLEALHEVGLETIWDGTASKRIQIQMTWQRRCPGPTTPPLLN